ncbi:PREDICTED: prefoldin [Prunus dulcis]|nr:PREDICTED: prefoldin [Prunus dulcis]
MYILQQKQWRRRQLFESFSANWRPKLTISAKFRKANISKNHQVRKKYTIQLGENELVLKELDLLSEDANVFKLIGPVLVKQDLAEARANVRKRIEYISAELKRLDATLQDLEEKQNSKKETMLKLQQRAQSLQAGKAKA